MNGSKLRPGSAQDCRPESLQLHGVGQVLGEIVCSRKMTLVVIDRWQRAKTTFESLVPPMGSTQVCRLCGLCGGSTRDVVGIHFCHWKSLCLIFPFDPAPIAGLLVLQFRLPIELHTCCLFPFCSMSNSVHQNLVEQAWRRAWKLFFLLVGNGALRAGPGAGLRVMLLLLLLVQRTKGEGWNLHFWVCSLAFCDGQPVCAMHG